MKIAVYSGSFDPITNGHVDNIKKAVKLVDKLIVVVTNNSAKKYLFNLEERAEMAREVLKNVSNNIEVKCFEGLLVDFMKENNSNLIIRGLRSVADYEYELTMAYGNFDISNGEVETIFIPAPKENLYLSSSIVREIASYGKSVEMYVDKFVEKKLKNKFKK